MQKFYLGCLMLTLSIGVSAQGFVPDFNPKTYVAYRAQHSLLIDGIANERDWQQALWTDDFVDIEGNKKPSPRFRTRVKMLWDEQFFYFLAELEEPHIWATLRQRDTVIFYDNDFEIFIDPDGDTHRYYEFEMNAFNTIWDLLLITPYRDHANAVLNAWDMRGVKTGVSIHGSINDPSDKDEKWTVEIALPWKVLKEQAPNRRRPEIGDYWRVNFSRVEWQVDVVEGKYVKRKHPDGSKNLREDNWVWSPQGVINMHRPETWGFVFFADQAGATSEITFEIPAHEYLKWELRKLYYAQRDYYSKNKTYADQLNELNIKIPDKTEMTSGHFGYTISVQNPDTGTHWHINEQGHTWEKD